MNIQKLLYDDMILSNAVHYIVNLAVKHVGYNNFYRLPVSLFEPASSDDEVEPVDIAVQYDLLSHGPDRNYDDQYREQTEAEYGELIDPTKDGLSEYEEFMTMERVCRRISVYEVICHSSSEAAENSEDESVLVHRVEGKGGMHCSYHRDGIFWQERIVELYKKSSEYHLINPTGEEPTFEEPTYDETIE